jgi:hypothetical protein
MLTRVVSLVTGLTALSASAVSAQPPVHLPINMTQPGVAAGALEVNDDTLVYVDITKSTFQSCTVETKTEAMPTPPNPIGQVLAALSPLVGGAAGPPPVQAPTVPPGEEALDSQLKQLELDTTQALTEANGQRDALRNALLNVPASLTCADHACVDVNVARTRLVTLRGALGMLIDTPAVSVTLLTARLAPLSKALVEKPSPQGAVEVAWRTDALTRVDNIQRMLDAINDRRQALGKAKEAINPLLERIDTFTPSTTQSVPISTARKAKTTVTVKCVNAVTQQPKIYPELGPPVTEMDVPQVVTTVTYADMPWATVTAGMLYSQLDKRQVGGAPFKTGMDSTGVDTFERRVAETDHGKTQLAPFTFLNIALCRCRAWTPAAAVGFGLNTNNGGKVLEYFVGGGLIIHGQLGIEVGRHIGSLQQPTNGFALDDVLPEKVTTVPTTRERTGAFAIGFTFKVPLPK